MAALGIDLPSHCSRPDVWACPPRIAVLLASHNRADRTLRCLQRIHSVVWPQGSSFRVFLLDDGSTDGTVERVAREYPDTVVMHGTGRLYWCNSMRMAWDRAAREDFDFYLWMNDDTELEGDAVCRLLQTWSEAVSPESDAVIVVGSCRDPVTGAHSYGGQLRPGRHPAQLRPVPPSDRAQPCDTFNGNIVLVPRPVFRRVGNMRPFAHAIGDIDYGLRAKAAGCRILVAPGYQGDCRSNDLVERFARMTMKERAAMIFDPKMLPPRSWFRFLWLHGGIRAFVYWPMLYVRLIFMRPAVIQEPA